MLNKLFRRKHITYLPRELYVHVSKNVSRETIPSTITVLNRHHYPRSLGESLMNMGYL
jgi:hypothetical protein